jgi:SPX domain protein involved in polyphosphate accumulation
MKNLEDFRYEKKFVISELTLNEIEVLIKHNPFIFSEIFYERRINNIYLDSLDLSNYEENLSGNSERFKIRIRWYGSTFGVIGMPILELKIKNNDLGRKLSFPLNSFKLDRNFSSNLLNDLFSKSNLPDWLSETLKLYSPSLLNSYKRKYFISADKKHRITLDNDLIFFKIKPKNNIFNHKIQDFQNIILELKYSIKDSVVTRSLIEHIPFRPTANSKYVCGINLLDL